MNYLASFNVWPGVIVLAAFVGAVWVWLRLNPGMARRIEAWKAQTAKIWGVTATALDQAAQIVLAQDKKEGPGETKLTLATAAVQALWPRLDPEVARRLVQAAHQYVRMRQAAKLL